jgi:PAS domain S-box-containing protein
MTARTEHETPAETPPEPPGRFGRRFSILFGLVVLIVVVAGHLEHQDFEAALLADRQGQLGAIAELKAEWVAQWRRERLGDAAAMRASAALVDVLSLPPDAVPEPVRTAGIRRLASVSGYRQYRSASLFDATGRLRLRWPEDGPAPSALSEAVVSRALDERGPLIVDGLDPRANDEPWFTVATVVDAPPPPVARPDPAGATPPEDAPPLGVVLLEVDADASLGPFLARWPTSLRTAENHLVRRDGTDVIFLEALSRTGHAPHARRVPLTRADVLAVQAATGHDGPTRGRDAGGAVVLGAIEPIAESGWAVVTHMDEAEFAADVAARRATVVAFIGLVLVAAGSLLALVLRRAARHADRRHGVLRGALAAKSTALDDLVARSPVVVYGMSLSHGAPFASRMTENIERVLGYTVAEATAIPWWPSNVHPDDLHLGPTAFGRIESEDTVAFEYRFRHKDGRWRWVRDRIEVTRRVDGRPVELAGALDDITERRETERALSESEERLRMALAAGQQGLFDLDLPTGRVVVSPGFALMLGYDPDQFSLTYDGWLASLHPDDVEPVTRAVAAYLAGESGDVYHTVFRMRTADGEYRWISSTGRLAARDADGRPLRMLGTHTDITSLKNAQLEAQRITRLYAALSRSAEAVVRNTEVVPLLQQVCEAAVDDGGFDMAWAGLHEPETGRIERVAQAGNTREYLTGLNLGTRPDNPTHTGPAAQSILRNEPTGIDDMVRADLDAIWKQRALAYGWQSILAFPLRRGGRPIGSLVLYARTPHTFDAAARRLLGQMTEKVGFALDALAQDERRVAAEAEVRRSLKEREALLKEIHHRVKNNLQVITSLLRLEANRAASPDVRAVLVEMKNRVLSMALLHELLYRSDTLASVNLSTYLTELGRQVFEGSALHAGVRLESRIDPVAVDLDQAVPCGLLVNELLANALKHAYPNGRRGVVRLTVSHALDPATGADAVAITVEDDGVGLAPDFENRRKRSLGLQMVTDLTRQLDGTLEIDAPSGARFRVRFERRGTIAAHGRPSLPPTAPPETVPASNPGRS